MNFPNRSSLAAAAAVAFIGMCGAAEAGSCAKKAAIGTGGDTQSAKFQVYEALLQATDWGAWASWMSNGTTPGYKVHPVKYKCKSGGIGIECYGQTTICKL